MEDQISVFLNCFDLPPVLEKREDIDLAELSLGLQVAHGVAQSIGHTTQDKAKREIVRLLRSRNQALLEELLGGPDLVAATLWRTATIIVYFYNRAETAESLYVWLSENYTFLLRAIAEVRLSYVQPTT